MMTERAFFAFVQLLGRDAGLFYFVDYLHDRLLRRLALFRINRRINAEQTRVAGRVGKSGDAVGEAALFAHALIQARAAAIAKNSGEQIERGNIWVSDL